MSATLGQTHFVVFTKSEDWIYAGVKQWQGRVPTPQGKQGKWTKTIPCQGKHRESDPKSNKIFRYLPRKFLFFRRIWIRQFCVCNCHKSRKFAQGKFMVRQGKHRENTGNSKTQFEWVPCKERWSSRHARPGPIYPTQQSGLVAIPWYMWLRIKTLKCALSVIKINQTHLTDSCRQDVYDHPVCIWDWAFTPRVVHNFWTYMLKNIAIWNEQWATLEITLWICS